MQQSDFEYASSFLFPKKITLKYSTFVKICYFKNALF